VESNVEVYASTLACKACLRWRRGIGGGSSSEAATSWTCHGNCNLVREQGGLRLEGDCIAVCSGDTITSSH